MREETPAETTARLLDARADFEVPPGIYVFQPLGDGPTSFRKDALAGVRDNWSQLIPVEDPAAPMAFRCSASTSIRRSTRLASSGGYIPTLPGRHQNNGARASRTCSLVREGCQMMFGAESAVAAARSTRRLRRACACPVGLAQIGARC